MYQHENVTESLIVKGSSHEGFNLAKSEIAIISPADTSSVKPEENKPAYYQGSKNIESQNFLVNISSKTLTKDFASPVKTSSPTKPSAEHIVNRHSGFEGIARPESMTGWLALLLIVSLFVFSWIKLLFQKLVVQVVVSIVDYQVSARMFRERNVLYRNASLGLNFVFAINLGIFVCFLFENFSLFLDQESDILTILIVSFSVLMVYIIKTMAIKLLGYLFLIRELMAEYVYNIHLFNKAIGVFLFPVVIFYPFTASEIKPYVLYFGMFIVVSMLFFRMIRGIQIIMRNEVSFFYLILYLCAVEILPVLLLVKLSTTLI